MMFLRKVLAAGMLISGMLTIPTALAADAATTDNLPELGAASEPQRAAPAAPLTGDAVCTRCHDKNEVKAVLSVYTTKHGVRGDSRAPGCQSCHGESEAHVKNTADTDPRPKPDVLFGTKRGSSGEFAPSGPREQNAACLTCHAKDSKRTHWDGGAHNVNDVACASCHENHAKQDRVRDKKTQAEVCFTCHKEQRAESKKTSHHPIGEGKVVCSDCHNPHGSSGPKLLRKNTVVETCYTCHAEKRGPYLFEHQPVTEDCTICHSPHGSNIAPLLKYRTPFLCQGCHDGQHISDSPVGPNAAGRQAGLTATTVSSGATGRSCMNCHVLIHGSNSPAGGYWQR